MRLMTSLLFLASCADVMDGSTNEEQYKICNQVIICKHIVETELEKCVICINDLQDLNPQYSVKQLADVIKGRSCEVILEYVNIGKRMCLW